MLKKLSILGIENGGSPRSETFENGGTADNDDSGMTTRSRVEQWWERAIYGWRSPCRERNMTREVTAQRNETLAVERGHTQRDETPAGEAMVVNGARVGELGHQKLGENCGERVRD
ncbi:hypothetical protein Fot_20826 [Forsythia ovata]|uniref:Uncharacterized protein n=1 Tax=Forsythia ovata TaxID=205694 RepID=A0ABD1UT39_9LAMI